MKISPYRVVAEKPLPYKHDLKMRVFRFFLFLKIWFLVGLGIARGDVLNVVKCTCFTIPDSIIGVLC